MKIADYELNRVYNVDCLAAMRKMPDKCFELAIVDPPYGGGKHDAWKGQARSRFGGIFNKFDIRAARTGGTWAEKYRKESCIKHWDVAPPPEYFQELFRVSENQVIWGGNYFGLPPTRCFLVWRKTTIAEGFSMAMCEYAWTSFNKNAKSFDYSPQDKDRFHPTQKPVALYAWILNNYAKPGDKILDTHGGSCSSAIACEKAGYDYLVFEIDEFYYGRAVRRIKEFKAQIGFFD